MQRMQSSSAGSAWLSGHRLHYMPTWNTC